MKKTLLTLILFSVLLSVAGAQTLHKEKEYQKAWCDAHCGQQEVILPDKTRVDCLTDTHAIEFDFAHKWAESIGQALYYAQATNKKAGIVLIVENGQKDEKYIKRLCAVSERYNITVWLIYPENLE